MWVFQYRYSVNWCVVVVVVLKRRCCWRKSQVSDDVVDERQEYPDSRAIESNYQSVRVEPIRVRQEKFAGLSRCKMHSTRKCGELSCSCSCKDVGIEMTGTTITASRRTVVGGAEWGLPMIVKRRTMSTTEKESISARLDNKISHSNTRGSRNRNDGGCRDM